MRKIVSAILIITMLMSTVLMVVPVNAVEGNGMTFSKGAANVYQSSKVIDSLPQTFEATVKATSTGLFQDIFAWAYPNGIEPIVWDINNDNGGLRLYCRNGETSASVIFNGLFANGSEYANKMLHLALVLDFDNSDVRLYIDGKEYTGTVSYTSGHNETTFLEYYKKINPQGLPLHTFGTDYRYVGDTWERNFVGQIRNACVFSDVRTPSEIKNDVNELPKKGEDNLILSYDTPAGTGNTIKDLSGNGYDVVKGQDLMGKTFVSSADDNYIANKKLKALPATIETRIKLSAELTTTQEIFACDTGVSGEDSIVFDVSGDDIRLWYGTRDAGVYKGVIITYADALSGKGGQTVHLAMTSFDLYINGTKFTGTRTIANDGSGGFSGDVAGAQACWNTLTASELSYLTVGGCSRSNHLDRYFKGTIYSVSAFSDARTAAEITNDYYKLPVEGEDNLLFSYSMARYVTRTDVIPDLSSNAYDISSSKAHSATAGISEYVDINKGDNFENLYVADKALYTMPKTIEADVTFDAISDLGKYWGTIVACYSYLPNQDYFYVDAHNDGISEGLSLRIMAGKADEDGVLHEKYLTFKGSLEQYRGKRAHFAVTVGDSDVNVYINGAKWSGTVTGDKAAFISMYKSLRSERLPDLTAGGDLRRNEAGQYEYDYTVNYDNYRWFRGQIHTVYAFTDIRTDIEVAKDRRNGVVPTDDDLLFGFDAANGFLTDESGNGYDLREGYYTKITVPAGYVPADFDGDGRTDDGAIAISTVKQLKAIEQDVGINYNENGWKTSATDGKKYYLTADLVVQSTDPSALNYVTPGEAIVCHTVAQRFIKDIYFDGNGHTIEFDDGNAWKHRDSGGSMDSYEPQPTALGIFGHGTLLADVEKGHIESNLTVWNLNITGVIGAADKIGETEKIDTQVGVLCRTGTSGDMKFRNIASNVDVMAMGKDRLSKRNVGGLVGKNGSGDITFENVYYAGTVLIKNDMWYSYDEELNIYYYPTAGGFVGSIVDGHGTVIFKNCINYGDVIVGGLINTRGVGGFVGERNGGDNLYFEDCVNAGNVIATNEGDNRGQLGGFVGRIYNNKTNKEVILTNCVNKGAVFHNRVEGRTQKQIDDHDGIGGIVGYAEGQNAFKLVIDNCHNEGPIGTIGRINLGGILGLTQKNVALSVKNCSNSGQIYLKEVRYHDMGYTGVAGLFGKLTGSTNPYANGEMLVIEGCSNSGKVIFDPTAVVGGADPANDNKEAGVSINAFVGAIVGNLSWHNDLRILKCVNYGSVTNLDCGDSNQGTAGGIVGTVVQINDKHQTIEDCVNMGDITAPGGAGGILGANRENQTDDGILEVLNCKNYGTVRGTKYGNNIGVGGIVGDIDVWTYATENIDNFTVNVKNCYNAGTVTSNGGWALGGIVGQIGYRQNSKSDTTQNDGLLTIENCVNAGTVHMDVAMDDWEDPYKSASGMLGLATEGHSVEIKNCINIGTVKTNAQYGASAYPMTQCIRTRTPYDGVNSTQLSTDFSLINSGKSPIENGNIFLDSSIPRTGTSANASYHKFSNATSTVADIETKINGYEDYSRSDKLILLQLLYSQSGSYKANAEKMAKVLLELSTMAAKYNSYNENDYTIQTWDPFVKSLARANILLVATMPNISDTNKVNDFVQAVLDAYEALDTAAEALAAPDYSVLDEAFARTYISDEKLMSDFEPDSRLAYENARSVAERALESRDQDVINAAAAALEVARNNLVFKTASYIMIIPAEIEANVPGDVTVRTAGFIGGTSLRVSAQSSITLTNAQNNTINGTVSMGNLSFGAYENCEKTASVNVVPDHTYYAGTYNGNLTFTVTFNNNNPVNN